MSNRLVEKAIFAAGCFWGVEHSFQQVKGLVATSVGYTGGDMEFPSYQDVCSGRTGHAEAVEIFFDPKETMYEILVKHFFEIHNPALISNATGKRSQYRSAVFYLDEEQREIAENLSEQLRIKNIVVGTEISPASAFYKAEEYHQNYYGKKGGKNMSNRYRKKF